MRNLEKKRYRCEQLSVVKLNNVISAHSTTKMEYLVEFVDTDTVVVDLTDSIYDFHNTGTQKLAAYICSNNLAKKRMKYKLDSSGKISKLLNIEEVRENWMKYRSDFEQNPYMKSLSIKNINNIIDAGNKEFLEKNKLLELNIKTNPFNQIMFGNRLRNNQDYEIEILQNQSSLFPFLRFDVDCRIETEIDNEDVTVYKKEGKPLFVNTSEIINLYDQFYKPQINNNFTDYEYHMEINYIIPQEDNLITEGNAIINESIINNIESLIVYDIRSVIL